MNITTNSNLHINSPIYFYDSFSYVLQTVLFAHLILLS
uniref:Uncharacterized protein n=1 Tax=Siphoviridae sp. ctiOl67 TaxID=2825622 RepID=A0A8S5QI53_9CAUD|nr:MAG TPA: hypothetical protein [Siphoviridae sp. ctiOl67]